ncbi:putative ABC-type transport system, periplasmic component [Vibrio nigripulchritudo MADA3029]|uniref:ABC transporter substrate-binding protein n=1 Tax=Vibrio nigripulchritudo TaxID=28173 RepID=UPI0003B1C242|nr:ABC transporter substrate-binding protein [Vibrio nigripulchritudo]CCN48171.1 putative ABC-type transport system, periplasmic component [Vibrio nigripulchritudo MADA3020]CCN54793.1 putative ABC-type transport system, periplasmic component [Vibrio nigripulchritudo MADA3021]CCN58332.1 putative ABC-type transport system, periplasmic component [Vibrio nigripulchritudo MADA3029]
MERFALAQFAFLHDSIWKPKFRMHLPMTVLFLLIFSFYCQASDKNQQFTIGLATWGGYESSVAGFKDGIAEFGLVEGKNLTLITGDPGTREEQKQNSTLKLKEARPDLVFSVTTTGTTLVKKLLPASTPIVFSVVTYPADSGLIESFEYSGNNLVGTSNYVSNKHYVTLLKKLLPNTRRIAIFHRDGEPNSKIQAANMLRLLKRENIEANIISVESIPQLTGLAQQYAGRVDAFMTTTDTLMQSGGEEALIKVSHEFKVPILSSNKSGILKGSTFGPVADFYTLGKIAGRKAGQILINNTPPTQLSSELQEPPQFLVNRKAMQLLNIRIPDDIGDMVTWVSE